MRSLAARGFSSLKWRRLSTTNVNGKKKHQLLTAEENSSERPPSNSQQHPPEEYGSNDFQVTNRDFIGNHFDRDYLESRSNVLAYGKQMKRDGTLDRSPPPIARAQETESRSSRNSNKSCRQGSWLSIVRRSRGPDQAGSKSDKTSLPNGN